MVIAEKRLVGTPPGIVTREAGEESKVVLILSDAVFESARRDRDPGNDQVCERRPGSQFEKEAMSSEQEGQGERESPMRLDGQDDRAQPEGCPGKFLI